MPNTRAISIRVTEADYQKLQDLATRHGRTVTSSVREVIGLILSGGSEADKRRQVSSEFLFLAMERWVQVHLPEQLEPLLVEADRRAEAFYAAS